MSERNAFLTIDAPEFEVLPRPRLQGVDDRQPDRARTSFQSAVIRSFIDVPDVPFEHAVVSIDVADGEALPAVGVLKSVIDAVVSARVLKNDRSALLSVRFTKFDVIGGSEPTVNVEVLPREGPSDVTWIRSMDQGARRKVARSVVSAVEYSDRSGVPGSATFSNPWVEDPAHYEQQLRQRWQDLVQSKRATCSETWAQDSILSALGLHAHLPQTYTEDGDNALLYIVDMLEVARRDILGTTADKGTLDQHLRQVSFMRDLDSGIHVEMKRTDRWNQYDNTAYYTDSSGNINPFDPDTM